MFTISPGVSVSEIDNGSSIPAVATTEAGIAGVFNWGPVLQRVLITSQADLKNRFGKPSNFNGETWFTASNFLDYGNQLYVVRVNDGTSALAVFSNTTAPNANTQTVNNAEVYNSGSLTFSANVAYIAKYPGSLGNSLRVSVCDSAAAYNSNLQLVGNSIISTSSNVAIAVGSNTAVVSIGFTGGGIAADANTQAYAIKNSLQKGDKILVGNSSIGTQYLQIDSVGAVTGNSTIYTFSVNLMAPYRLHTNWSSNTVNRYWEFYNRVSGKPTTSSYVASFGNTAAIDEMHVVIVDDTGGITGTPGNILETFSGLSRATDGRTIDGSTNYYKTVLNNNSQFIWWANDASNAPSANALTIATASTITPTNYYMQGGSNGSDESSISLGNLGNGYSMFADASQVDISFILCGKSRDADGVTLVNYAIDNIAESRKDCIVFASPNKSAVVNNSGNEMDACVNFANQLRSSSYGFLDSGYKYQYDSYNDIYRWVPLNGDMAGLCVRTDNTNDAWWSPAGLNRGKIKNVVKLSWNPRKGQRDILTQASVNACINEPGIGPVLFDDRTLLKKNSPFRAINVRRLFIVIEKAIATDAKFALFEFNDDFTRAQFRNRINPYLRDIQGRRGITGYQVVCDSSNNTDQVINNEQFVGDIYIKPNRVIRAIQLNFIAVNGSVTFSENVGQF